MKELLALLGKLKVTDKSVFRGEDSDWPTKPKVGREYAGRWEEASEHEFLSLKGFRSKAIRHLNPIPTEDIDCLAIMQHYGCATRLLDVTTNPLVAIFFACYPTNGKSRESDGVVLTIPKGPLIGKPPANGKLFSHEQDMFYQPPHVVDRITSQCGGFIYCSKPNQPLDVKGTDRTLVLAKEKDSILCQLAHVGVSYGTIYPGLEGVCRDLSVPIEQYLKYLQIFESWV